MVDNGLSEHALRNASEILARSIAARKMSNRDLVMACLRSDLQDEILIEEMMSRLYPGWDREENEW